MKATVAAAAFAVLAGCSPYALVSGGLVKSSQQSNSDEIEFGDEEAVQVSVEAGTVWRIGSAGVSLGAELAHREQDLHGQNGHSRRSADGQTLRLTSVAVNGRIEYRAIGPVGLYGMAGAGGAVARGLGDTDIVPVAQAEAGIAIDLTDRLSIGAGYRMGRAFDLHLDGNRGDADFNGPLGWIRWRF